MRTEALFFKTLFLVFLSFYIASYLIFLILAISIENRGYSTTNLIKSIDMIVSLPFWFGFFATIFFSPVLLFVSFVQWWIKNNKLKNFISFSLVIIYGCIIFILTSLKSSNSTWFTEFTDQDKILDFLLLSIPSTALFLIILIYLVSRD